MAEGWTAKAGQSFSFALVGFQKKTLLQGPTMQAIPAQLPESGFVRLPQIIGRKANPKAKRPQPELPALIPVSKSTWWAGIAAGRFPKPVKIGPHTTVWEVSTIRALIARLTLEGARQ